MEDAQIGNFTDQLIQFGLLKIYLLVFDADFYRFTSLKLYTDLVGAQRRLAATARTRTQTAVVTLVADTVSELGLVAYLTDGVVGRRCSLGRRQPLLLLLLLLLLLRFLIQFLHRRLVVLEVVLKVPAPVIYVIAVSSYTSRPPGWPVASGHPPVKPGKVREIIVE